MSKAQLSYIDEKYPPSAEIIKLSALTTIMKTVITMRPERNPDIREEGKQAGAQMLEVIQRSGHLEEEEYINGQLMIAYSALARIHEAEETKEGCEKALEYLGKARDFYKSGGQQKIARELETAMNRVKSMRDGQAMDLPSEQLLKDIRHDYLKSAKERGEESSDTVQSGIILTGALLCSGENSFECERLCVKLLTISRRVHGPDHDLTDRIEWGLRQSRVRRLVKVTGDGPVDYQVVEVRDDEKKYIVMPRGGDGLAEVAFDDDYLIMPGTPVACNGLKNAQHLNGKLGDATSFDAATRRYVVRFEDQTLRKALVKAVNLRIVIDLPGES